MADGVPKAAKKLTVILGLQRIAACLRFSPRSANAIPTAEMVYISIHRQRLFSCLLYIAARGTPRALARLGNITDLCLSLVRHVQ